MHNLPLCLARLGEVAGPMVPKPQLCSGWTMGLIPWASCLAACQLPFASALEPCSPAFLGEGLWSPSPGADHHCWAWQTLPSWQGSWTDMPYAALQGQSGKGPFALPGLWPIPPHTHSSLQPSPPPTPHLALAAAHFSAVEPASHTGPSRG